jgi:hypothetical protein
LKGPATSRVIQPLLDDAEQPLAAILAPPVERDPIQTQPHAAEVEPCGPRETGRARSRRRVARRARERHVGLGRTRLVRHAGRVERGTPACAHRRLDRLAPVYEQRR